MTKRKPPKKKWQKLKPPYEVGLDGFRNRDVEKDEEGWALESKYRPFQYDLVRVMTKESKIKVAWWCGNCWDGPRLNERDQIEYWQLESLIVYSSEDEAC